MLLRDRMVKGFGVSERDNRAGYGGTMLTIDQDQTGPATADEASRCLTLVRTDAQVEQQAPKVRAPRPDAGFVAHLIASAEKLPQTRALRRAAPADAKSAYTALLQPATALGGRTRQVV